MDGPRLRVTAPRPRGMAHTRGGPAVRLALDLGEAGHGRLGLYRVRAAALIPYGDRCVALPMRRQP